MNTVINQLWGPPSLEHPKTIPLYNIYLFKCFIDIPIFIWTQKLSISCGDPRIEHLKTFQHILYYTDLLTCLYLNEVEITNHFGDPVLKTSHDTTTYNYFITIHWHICIISTHTDQTAVEAPARRRPQGMTTYMLFSWFIAIPFLHEHEAINQLRGPAHLEHPQASRHTLCYADLSTYLYLYEHKAFNRLWGPRHLEDSIHIFFNMLVLGTSALSASQAITQYIFYFSDWPTVY